MLVCLYACMLVFSELTMLTLGSHYLASLSLPLHASLPRSVETIFMLNVTISIDLPFEVSTNTMSGLILPHVCVLVCIFVW